ncbi:type IV toxin-antitoxin system AbiEi family antitoxin domain-containing protein [Patescibacteria group bacterium]|nr:type IV toxin-antitoxin system AbiEi family antitoxin domain-containing protein [Patescibacteria group bacterium]
MKNKLQQLYQSGQSVITTNELGMIWQLNDRAVLRNKIYYWVKTGKLHRLQRGVYALRVNYNQLELAGKVLSPSYVSLSTVLQQEGVVFQYDETITSIANLSREFEVAGVKLSYRKIQDKVLFNDLGLERKNSYTIASKERALLDMMYLAPGFYADNLAKIDWEQLLILVEIYDQRRLKSEVHKLYKTRRE